VVRILLPILLVVAAILAVVASAAGEETRAELDYLAEVRAQAAELSKAGDTLRVVVSRLHRIDRLELVTAIDGIRADLEAGLDFVEQAPPTRELLPVRALYRASLTSWEKGIIGYSSAVLTAADELENETVIDVMADGLAELRAGDSVYLDLQTEYEAFEGGSEPISTLPPVQLMPAQGAIVSLSTTYIDSARNPNNGLALRPGLSVSQVISDPEWQVDPDEQAVVPATDSISFSVVVTNIGNVVSIPETVVLTLVGGPEEVRLQSEIRPLQPASQITVRFDELQVEPGSIYQVSAAVVVTGDDTNLEDNEIRVQFEVNEG
jgi:hypothetical protein